MKTISYKNWLIGFVVMAVVFFGVVAAVVVYVDPKFYYHAPHSKFYYELDSDAEMNYGIGRFFEYDALITGTCMSDCFLASQADELFGLTFVKLQEKGGGLSTSRKEMENAFKYHDGIKMVICSLDMNFFPDSSNEGEKTETLEEKKEALMKKHPFVDLSYIYNRDVLFNRSISVLRNYIGGVPGGVDSFDGYGYWLDFHPYLLENWHPDFKAYKEIAHMTKKDKAAIKRNIKVNIIDVAKAHPDTEFYYFLTPYSGAWWGYLGLGYEIDDTASLPEDASMKKNNFYRQLEQQQYVIELLLECPNVKVFSFNDRFDITTDLNNYVDLEHYNADVNAMMLDAMKAGDGLLTKDNYKEHLKKVRTFYENFDFLSMYTE